MNARPSRLFVLALLGLLIVTTLGLACTYWRIYGPAKLFGDFSIFHEAARNAVTHQFPAIYDVARLREKLAAGSQENLSFFLNPPTALFLIYPLGFLSATSALLLWSVLQIVLLCAALRTEHMRRLFASAFPQAIPVYVLLGVTFLAFSLQNLLFGQAALLCTDLFLFVLALRRLHPVLAGVVLGIFSFKPQLGIVLPVLLLAEKNWKALLWAVLVTSGMILLSAGVFGIQLWQDYRETLVILGQFLARPQPTIFALNLSPYAALRNLGMPAGMAFTCQCALSLGVLALIWPVLRRGEESYKILIVTLATYLVSPYSLVYDIPLLAIACALMMRRTEADEAGFYELIALLLLIVLPLVAILLQLAHIPYSVVAIGFALGVARRRPLNSDG